MQSTHTPHADTAAWAAYEQALVTYNAARAAYDPLLGAREALLLPIDEQRRPLTTDEQAKVAALDRALRPAYQSVLSAEPALILAARAALAERSHLLDHAPQLALLCAPVIPAGRLDEAVALAA